MLDSMDLERWIFAPCALQALDAFFELNKSEMKFETLGAIICASIPARFKKELADTASREGANPISSRINWLYMVALCKSLRNRPK